MKGQNAPPDELKARWAYSELTSTRFQGDYAGIGPQHLHDMASKGFRVLDTKPNHIILRRRRDGSLLRRHGKLVYAMVDFELLQRTPEAEKSLVENLHTEILAS